MISLAALAAALPPELAPRILAPADRQANPLLTEVAYDSRQVKAGNLFCCVPGHQVDGARFLPAAVEAGAVAALAEREIPGATVPVLQVASVRRAMPLAAAVLHQYPSRRLHLVGVTGTNGKTTTTYLVEAIARAAGRSTGVIGTIGSRINQQALEGDRTTPEGPDLQALFARMAAVTDPPDMTVAMEVSSHALDLGRTLGCEFDVGVFTNLTQDHLDYHGTMEAYFAAKARLFTEYPDASAKPFTGVINLDDAYGARLASMCRGSLCTYGVHSDAQLRARDVEASATSLRFRLQTPEGEFPVSLRLGGLFNVANSLAAMGAARALGLSWEQILAALSVAPGVPGRFESVSLGQDFGVIVDYAHTPDGLDNVLRAARALHPRRLITVFGCGGDRDRTKRPLMGRIAAECSGITLVTSDNPRTEDPESILDEIMAGIPAGRNVEREVDRRRAIQRAIELAQPGDLVVIAGKGHEDYQILGTTKIHFDDREEAAAALRLRGYHGEV